MTFAFSFQLSRSIPQGILPSPQGKKGNESFNQLLGTVHRLKLFDDKTRKEVQSMYFYMQSVKKYSRDPVEGSQIPAELLPSAKFLG